MPSPKITLYLDVISPFAYIAYHITRTSPAFQKCEITYVPVLIGGIMAATGNQPPINIKNKDKWTDRERLRWRDYFHVPMTSTMPQPFPQPTINAQRALCFIAAQEQSGQEKLISAFDALFKVYWVEGKKIGDLEVVASALKAAGLDGEGEVVEGVKGADAKRVLRENTEKAFAEGAFGLPWFVATNEEGKTEGFWGVDHIGQLMDFLGLERKGDERFRALL